MKNFCHTFIRQCLFKGGLALICLVSSSPLLATSIAYLPKNVLVLDLGKSYELQNGRSYAILQDNLAFQNNLVQGGKDSNIEMQSSFDLGHPESSHLSTRRQMLKLVFKSLRRAKNQVENAIEARKTASLKVLEAEGQEFEPVIKSLGPNSVKLMNGEKVFLHHFFGDQSISREQKLYELFQHIANQISIKDGIVISYQEPVDIKAAPPEQALFVEEFLARAGYKVQSLATYMNEARIYGRTKRNNVELLQRPENMEVWFPGMFLAPNGIETDYGFDDFQKELQRISDWKPIVEHGLQEYEAELKMKTPENMAFVAFPIDDINFKKLERIIYKLHLLVEFSAIESVAVTLLLADKLHEALPDLITLALKDRITEKAKLYFEGNKQEALSHAEALLEDMFEEDLQTLYTNIIKAMEIHESSTFDDMSYNPPAALKRDQTLYFGNDENLFSNFVNDVILN